MREERDARQEDQGVMESNKPHAGNESTTLLEPPASEFPFLSDMCLLK